MARIGIDARFYGSIGKGLGRYTQKLIEHLEKIDDENQYFVFLRCENFEEYVPKNRNFKKILADYDWYSFAEQLAFPRMLYSYNLDLMHFPHFNVPILYFRKFVITIHDLILLHFPTKRATTLGPIWYWIKFRAYKLAINSAIMRCQRIIAVSEFTKNDILSRYPASRSKITITYEACEKRFPTSAGKSGQILEKYGIIKPYFLYVGNAYPHKNLEQLVLAFKSVSNDLKDLNLVLVGKEDYFYSRLKDEIARERIKKVIFPGFVSDQDLSVIYDQAMFYIFPSLYEGFGLPPLEAMEHGIPVLSSDSSCLPEILGDAAYFFEAGNPDAIVEAIVRIFSDENLRKGFIEKGHRQVRKYSWGKMAQQTLQIYKET